MRQRVLAYVIVDVESATEEREKQRKRVDDLLNKCVDRNGTISLLTAEVVRLNAVIAKQGKVINEQTAWGRAIFARLY